MYERELKLQAPASFKLPDLADVAPGVASTSGEVQRLRTTYWDTDDLRLARWRCTLRYRAGDGWTVKLPGEVLNDMLGRPELSFEGPASNPPGKALDVLVAFLRGARVRPVVHLRTRRHPVELRSAGGLRASVTLDDVTVVDDGRGAERFRELEVEVNEEAGDDIIEAVRGRLVAAGAAASEPTPKHVRALGARALARPDVEIIRPGRTATTGEVIRSALASSVRRLILHDPAVRLSPDPEGIHRCRVAIRRLRSDLATFRAHVDTDRSDRLRSELRWLGQVLGEVRDADVLLDLLSGLAEALPTPTDRKVAARSLRRLSAERDGARSRLLEAMRQGRYMDLLEEGVRTAREPGLVPDADLPARDVLGPEVDRAWRRLRRAVAGLGDPPSDEELHRVRIRAKQCRYTAEAVAPVLGKPGARLARLVARIQEILGEHQDAAVAGAWLRQTARGASGTGAFTAGILADQVARRREGARRSFPEAWRRAARAADKVRT